MKPTSLIKIAVVIGLVLAVRYAAQGIASYADAHANAIAVFVVAPFI